MGASGGFHLENIPVRLLPEIIRSMQKLAEVGDASFEVVMQGRGATRKGDIVDLNGGSWYRLDVKASTERKRFYAVYVDHAWVKIRPENDLFTTVKIDFIV